MAPRSEPQMKIRLGKPEIAFGVLLVIYIALTLTVGPNLLTIALKIVLAILGSVIFIRLSHLAVRRALWRLRNRRCSPTTVGASLSFCLATPRSNRDVARNSGMARHHSRTTIAANEMGGQVTLARHRATLCRSSSDLTTGWIRASCARK